MLDPDPRLFRMCLRSVLMGETLVAALFRRSGVLIWTVSER
jgi:hypothetical protein